MKTLNACSILSFVLVFSLNSAASAIQETDVKQIVSEIQSKHIEERITGIEKGASLTGPSGQPVLHPEILDALIGALADRESDVQAAAARALRRFGTAASKAIPALIAQMSGIEGSSDDVFRWIDCSRTLTAIGPESIPHLIEAMDAEDQNTYKGACQSLHDLAPTLSDMLAEPVVNEMIERISAETGQRRWAIVFVLRSLGRKAKPAVAGLTDALSDEDFQVRIMSCQALAGIGKPSKPAAKRLLELTEQGNVSERGFAAIALGSIGVIDEFDTVKVLTDLLADSNQVVKERAMIGLSRLGKDAVTAVPEIESAINGDSFAAKPIAALAHWKITGQTELALKTLIPLINNRTHELSAIESLGRMGIEAESAIDAIINRAETEDESILIEISIAFSRIGSQKQQVMDLLNKLAESEDLELKGYATEALAKLKK